jgi:hypothetical protein
MVNFSTLLIGCLSSPKGSSSRCCFEAPSWRFFGIVPVLFRKGIVCFAKTPPARNLLSLLGILVMKKPSRRIGDLRGIVCSFFFPENKQMPRRLYGLHRQSSFARLLRGGRLTNRGGIKPPLAEAASSCHRLVRRDDSPNMVASGSREPEASHCPRRRSSKGARGGGKAITSQKRPDIFR